MLKLILKKKYLDVGSAETFWKNQWHDAVSRTQIFLLILLEKGQILIKQQQLIPQIIQRATFPSGRNLGHLRNILF